MSQSDGPIVDEERIAQTYEELGRMHMKLDSNPIEYGPKRFNNKIARARAMLTRVEQIFLQISEDLQWLKRTVLRKRTIYELDKRDLMVNEVRVRAGRSQTEREALADVELRDQIEDIQSFEIKIQDLEMLMTVIKAKRSDLKDMQGRMRDQMKLIEHDISMGARWGRAAPPDPLSDSSSDIDNMLADVDTRGGWSSDDEDDDEPQSSKKTEASNQNSSGEEEEDPVIEFAGLQTSEDEDEEDEEEDSIFGAIESAIPQEGEEGNPLEQEDGGSSESQVDEFLDKVSDKEEAEEPVSGPFDDGPGIDDLIATLTDDT